MMIVIAVLLCVVSAVAYAGAAVLQERVAERRLLDLLRMPAWWLTLALNGVGALLHVGALRYGPLALVQPLGVLTLALAVPMGAIVARRRVTHVEASGIVLTIGGLTAILLLVGSSNAGISALTSTQFVGLLLATAALLAALGFRRSGLWDAAAGGIAFGVSSALTQTVAVRLSGFLLFGVAIAALTTAGLLFTQRSYRGGLGAPLAVSTLANPIAAAAIGFLLLGERIAGGMIGVLAAMAGAVLAGVGVVQLTRSAGTKARPSTPRRRLRAERFRRGPRRPSGSPRAAQPVASCRPGRPSATTRARIRSGPGQTG
jgi:hypothetical protein